MPHKDQHYIEALLNNDTLKIEEIYQRFSGKIIGFVIQNNGSEAEAKDIFQEALISIYQKAQAGKFELTCPFEAYLFMVCKSKWINVLKSSKKKKETILDQDGYNDTGADILADETLEYENKMQLLERKLEQLGESCRNILTLSWKGVGLENVAKQLKISYAYVRKKKSGCTAQLIKLVKEDPSFINLKLA